jgi:hypothetical protein
MIFSKGNRIVGILLIKIFFFFLFLVISNVA